jgi:exosortase family protein XrtM
MTERIARRRAPVLFVAGFLFVYCALYALFYVSRGGPVERLVIHDATVTPAAGLARILEPATDARAVGNRIYSSRGSLVVQSGCEGIETLFILWAAIAVFPASLRAKGVGIAWGTLLVYGLNQVRLVALFLVSHHSRPLFEALHGYVAPTFIVLLVGVFFIGWTAHSGGSPNEPTTNS